LEHYCTKQIQKFLLIINIESYGIKRSDYEKIFEKIAQLEYLGERFREVASKTRARSGVGRHTELKNLQKALPDHLRGCKESKEAIKDLINKEFLNIKLSTGEKHVSLNSHKQKEIYEFVREE